MMTAVETWLQRGRRTLRTLGANPRLKKAGTGAAWGAAGFFLSAAALGSSFQPLAMGLICGLSGWRAGAAAVGSLLGYRVFWGRAGTQGMVCAALGCLTALTLGRQRLREALPLLIPAAAGCLVSGCGLVFQLLWKDQTPVPVYLLRIGLAAASAGLFSVVVRHPESRLRWGADGIGILALAQVAPVSWLGAGWIAAGWLTAGGEWPGVLAAGMALDLAGITPVPMTLTLGAAFLSRFLPIRNRWVRYLAPGAVYGIVMAAANLWDLLPLPGLLLGGAVAAVLPPHPTAARYRGRTGMAQVRLELVAGVMQQSRQLLMEAREAPVDREALLCRVRERACGSCPSRKQCRDIQIPPELLESPPLDTGELGLPCKKPGRMALELRRGQEQLRALRADRRRQQEYREAVIQQYGFLGEYLRDQADLLAQRGSGPRARLRPEVGIRSVGKEAANGDLCIHFPGTECRYYVLLCDGMGTGLGAAGEGQTAGDMLRQLLSAGYPAEHALRSLNSLLTLSGRAGAVTVDLAEIRLDTGRVTLYKWGAAPSWLLKSTGPEKIGTAGPPPGLSVGAAREAVERLSLRRGEALILFSDGAEAQVAWGGEGISPESPPGELAAELLERAGQRGDDATAAVVRLVPGTTGIS